MITPESCTIEASFQAMHMSRFTLFFATTLLFAALPQLVLAHVTATGPGGFTAGFEHPLTGYDHLLAMFSVGVWGAQMGGAGSGRFRSPFP
ncbi:hypothetical protein RGUI_2580 [Rhodovulum sp. P5]|nr:HupE/UreJ family protein [Rhodovulum sp. P5]ARE40721.1 hypothetical protein RGUI_2580 [Rhodovulum sp. P5]